MTQGNQIFTDEALTNILLGIISFLITVALALLVYIWNRREKQYEQARLDEKEYKKTLEVKFEALNSFIREQEIINVKQEVTNQGFQKDINHLRIIRDSPPPPPYITPAHG